MSNKEGWFVGILTLILTLFMLYLQFIHPLLSVGMIIALGCLGCKLDQVRQENGE